MRMKEITGTLEHIEYPLGCGQGGTNVCMKVDGELVFYSVDLARLEGILEGASFKRAI